MASGLMLEDNFVRTSETPQGLRQQIGKTLFIGGDSERKKSAPSQ